MLAVRKHVLWLRHAKQLAFLCNLSKFVEGKKHLKDSLNAKVLPGERSSKSLVLKQGFLSIAFFF